MSQGHRREGSRSSIRAFVAPEVSLSSSLKPSMPAAQPVSVEGGRERWKWEVGADGGGEGSSTESQSHMREGMGAVPRQYVDTVVDSQYVLIEASPPTGAPHEPKVLPRERTSGEKTNRSKDKPAKV